MSDTPLVRSARLIDLAPEALYAILKLRSDVFVVEQQCAYADLDGRDTDPDTVHMWLEDDDEEVVAALRILGGAVPQIGRIATRADRRRQGLGALLLHGALEQLPRPVEVRAQARLQRWYATFGFVRCSDEWVEDGIAHVQMRLSTEVRQ